jgi:hypothetical protein
MSGVTIEVPELGLSAASAALSERRMALEPRQTRGDGDIPVPIRSEVVLGGPDAARMQARGDDKAELADRRENDDFWSVLMTLTFDPVEPEIVASAWLRVDLSSRNDGVAPVAYAMEPDRQEDDVQRTQSEGAQATLKLIQISGSTARTYTVHQAEVLAKRKLRSDPAWDFMPSQGRPISGGIDLTMVVKAPKGTSGRGVVTFGATIEWQEGLFRRSHEVSWAGESVAFDFS